ncbi:MAG: SH3 domain-containing protein [Clostridia bacterium]|nr:SH3 domain-containing protein [Clostridia bacterium]
MKRMLGIMAFLLALVLLTLVAPSALACEYWYIGDVLEVVNCREYVTLRSEPNADSEAVDFIRLGDTVINMGGAVEGFTEVMYNGRTGYVKNEYLKNSFSLCDDCESVDLSEKERYNVNLFLTNFTEQGMLAPSGVLETASMEDHQLVEFAVEHIWYNRQDYLEWGDFFNGNNVRLSDAYIPAVCQKYFGRTPLLIHDSIYDMADNHYYWQETGGHAPMGFANLFAISHMGGGRYRVSFCVYGQGMEWEDDVYSLGERELAHAHPEYFNGEETIYGTKYNPYGNAIINVNGGSLSDRSSWTLERLVLDWAA